jgi:hypothetical protein
MMVKPRISTKTIKKIGSKGEAKGEAGRASAALSCGVFTSTILAAE